MNASTTTHCCHTRPLDMDNGICTLAVGVLYPPGGASIVIAFWYSKRCENMPQVRCYHLQVHTYYVSHLLMVIYVSEMCYVKLHITLVHQKATVCGALWCASNNLICTFQNETIWNFSQPSAALKISTRNNFINQQPSCCSYRLENINCQQPTVKMLRQIQIWHAARAQTLCDLTLVCAPSHPCEVTKPSCMGMDVYCLPRLIYCLV